MAMPPLVARSWDAKTRREGKDFGVEQRRNPLWVRLGWKVKATVASFVTAVLPTKVGF